MSASGAPHYSSLHRSARTIICLLVLCCVADVIALVIEVNYYGVLGELDRGVDLSVQELAAADTRLALAGGFQLVSYLAAMIAFVVWFRLAYGNLRALGAGTLRYKPGWAIGSWFVPILSLFRPKQIANDIWRASDPSLPRDAAGWQGAPVHSAIHWWWGVWIVVGVLGNLSWRTYMNAETLEEQLQASAVSAVSDVGFIVAAVLAILVVHVMTDRQDARAAMMSAPPPTPQPLPGAPPPPEPQPLQPA